MATILVTALTKVRMLAIEAASVISGAVDGTTHHLILTKHDGSTIDAGYVKGDKGDTGATSPPSGTAAGDLAGTYPNPTIKLLAVTDAKVAAANKDGASGTASMRTLGTGSAQAAAGNDARFPTAWAAYTPTLTNITLGNGSISARWRQVGKAIEAVVIITFGSTTTITSTPFFTLPTAVGTNAPSTNGLFGYGAMLDNSATKIITSSATRSGSNVRMNPADGSAVGSGAPWTWATSDNIQAHIFYEID